MNKRKKPALLRRLKITNSMIADWFGYKDVSSFNNSHCKGDIYEGIISALTYTSDKILSDPKLLNTLNQNTCH